MRLWTLHPSYLDTRGLVAAWREGLLAQKVLLEQTRGYRAHPQLIRFRAHRDPVASIGTWLRHLYTEAETRGWSFDGSKIQRGSRCRMTVTRAQLEFEREHLRAKLMARDPAKCALLDAAPLRPHPMCNVIEGEIEPWERVRS
ncbi:MAG TPA: pyrimidine dimer DNA glycosylase/endonuclease V [Thermoanaerobaculia bacterium]|nr:pyrimidine dimer DNA glycosylase/endonuclease V [Thermoanaerobaculia bacterium]